MVRSRQLSSAMLMFERCAMCLWMALLGTGLEACSPKASPRKESVTKGTRILPGLSHPKRALSEVNCVVYEYFPRVKHAWVVWADYDLMLEDFPELRSLAAFQKDEPRTRFDPRWDAFFGAWKDVDEWLLANFAVMSARQVSWFEIDVELSSSGSRQPLSSNDAAQSEAIGLLSTHMESAGVLDEERSALTQDCTFTV